jgi:hypothetical protein
VLQGLSPALSGLSSALPGAPRLVVGTPSLVASAPRCSQVHLIATISNKPSFRQEHPGVCDSPDGSDRSSCALTENQTRWVALHTSPAAAIIACLLFPSHCTLRLPHRRQASFALRPECGDIFAPSERHVCYTIRSTYVVAVDPTPSAVYAFHRPSATFQL